MPERWRRPFASSPEVRERMRAVARHDTTPELNLRRALHRLGLRYYVHRRPLPQLARQADIVFPNAKIAVFVDGCFWHGCPEHGQRVHRINEWYWPTKIECNKARDLDTDAQLTAAGWEAIRVWEHEDAATAAESIDHAVKYRTRTARSPGIATK
ncbi:MAG: very short patch repair endonuclease [Acidimicrobiales bacterium]